MATPGGIGAHIKKLKENPETSATGSRWTPEEDETLLLAIQNDKNTNDIALEHKRTVGAIVSRIKAIAVRMIETDNLPIETVSAKLHMPVEEILLFQKAKNNSKKKKTSSGITKNGETIIGEEKILDVLKGIRDVLLRIETNSALK
jgi:hypothetical protein